MVNYSLSGAAKATGRSKPTISKAIKTGRLSAKREGNGYEIDGAALFSVYPMETENSDTELTNGKPQVSLLEMEVRMPRQQLDQEQETATDLRERLTHMETLITDHRSLSNGQLGEAGCRGGGKAGEGLYSKLVYSIRAFRGFDC